MWCTPLLGLSKKVVRWAFMACVCLVRHPVHIRRGTVVMNHHVCPCRFLFMAHSVRCVYAYCTVSLLTSETNACESYLPDMVYAELIGNALSTILPVLLDRHIEASRLPVETSSYPTVAEYLVLLRQLQKQRGIFEHSDGAGYDFEGANTLALTLCSVVSCLFFFLCGLSLVSWL
jgi:hypothetical protein